MERLNRDGDNSPARLTIAQAALLNLKGPSLQGGSPQNAGSSFGSGLSPTFGSNMALPTESMYDDHILGSQFPPYSQEAVNASLQTFGVNRLGSQLDGLNAQAAEFTSRNQLRMPQDPVLDLNVGSSRLGSQLQNLGTQPKAAVRAQDGFTSYERLLLQVHLQHQQEQLAAASAELDSLRAQTSAGLGGNAALTLGGPPLSGTSTRRMTDFLPSMSEDEFHAGAARRLPLESRSAAVEIKVPPSRQALDLPDAKANFTRQRNQTHAEARAQADAQKNQAHLRSTTLPSQYTSRSSGGTFLNSAVSEGNALKNANVKSSFDSKKNITYSSNNRILSGNSVNTNANTISDVNTSNNISINPTHRDNIPPFISQQQALTSSTGIVSNNNNNNNNLNNSNTTTKNTHTRIDTSLTSLMTPATRAPVSKNEQDSNESGSEMSSPALSASTRTPATLSPATPFSAFAETFDGPAPTVVVPGTIVVGEAAVQKEVGLGIGAGAGTGAGKKANVA